MTLTTLMRRLRTSLSFDGFRAGGAVHKTEAQKTEAKDERQMQLLESLDETRIRIRGLQKQFARGEAGT